MSEDERKVAELTGGPKINLKERKQDRKAMAAEARAELDAAARQAEMKKAAEDKAYAEKMAKEEERRKHSVVKHPEKSDDIFAVSP
jgi:hypothetical protein